MSEITLYEAQVKKMQGICDEHNLTYRFLKDRYLRPRTPPMFCVRCYNCGRAGTPKGTKKTAIRAWKKAK